jgi:transcriptional regulator with XRE-family HTH domain
MSTFKLKLKDFIDKNKINLSTFEQKAGLKRSILYTILSDKSKNPSLENISKIADTLDCSIDELLGREDYFKKYIRNHRSGIKYYKELLEQILEVANQYISKNQITEASLGDIFYVVEEIYEYSVKTNNGLIDKKFALWMLENQLLK